MARNKRVIDERNVLKDHCETCPHGAYDGGYYDEYYCTVECPDRYDSLCLICKHCEYKETCKKECAIEDETNNASVSITLG